MRFNSMQFLIFTDQIQCVFRFYRESEKIMKN